MNHFRITFITPLFSKGSYDDRPEIRPSSIRGQLHWWFRALGGNYDDEKSVFGGIHGGTRASKVVVRVSQVAGRTREIPTLPHKRVGQASPKWAYEPRTSCDLHISFRLGGLDARLAQSFQNALEAWLLMGTLGLRGTRAGGSFDWLPLESTVLRAPANFSEYRERCGSLLKAGKLKFHLIDKAFSSAEEARCIVSDTLGGRDDRPGETALAPINHPFGKVFGGRKTSPLRFRVIKLGSSFHIAAIWDNRSHVTGNHEGDLQAAIRLLEQGGKPLGRLLVGAFEK